MPIGKSAASKTGGLHAGARISSFCGRRVVTGGVPRGTLRIAERCDAAGEIFSILLCEELSDLV